MSKLRAMIVREESLAGLRVIVSLISQARKRRERKSVGNRDTILAMPCAFLGALLGQGCAARVKDFIYQVMIPKVEAGTLEMIKDYKTHLQELLQVNGCGYSLPGSETAFTHDKVFDGVLSGRKEYWKSAVTKNWQSKRPKCS